ncbi:MAG TPA: fumarylacetoacetase [Cryomorphaceae bacterium]|nr:fumarylacetoacetase [Owenweeksia sp.]MBG00414.1 fumarylacetoacetase [Owenweeksia sp.]HAD98411.1 fumarylacetoacetase [Cryomorphaceae bacterium]HCQ15286.1 fumarylacetoacetase [Cryomorphaceae bacterium]|tara:strand:- start:1027 stop:2298 length:1272 start_codon:yes stop_codon:yes gene_type:complete
MLTANDPNRKSWLETPENTDFPIQNIPFGVFMADDDTVSIGTRIGDTAIDLSALQQLGYLNGLELPNDVFLQDTLNDFITLGRPTWRAVRNRIAELFDADNEELRENQEHQGDILFDAHEVQMLMPVFIQDYTDFYSSREHAENVGIMFRGKENALMPNWLHMPIGYHGRSSSIIISGEDVHRPKGQTMPPNAEKPVFGPSKRLDFELEMAFITTDGKNLGESISVEEAEEYIFGMVLFNDWSARDIQKWEYQPLGPFLGKNFASSISPWVVTLDALEPFRTSGPKQDPEPLEYLQNSTPSGFDINLDVYLAPEGGEDSKISSSNFKYMYWSMAQQLAHHTVNGCNINAGDMMASGTISGPTEESYGSMLELSWSGSKPVKLADGQERTFIEDGDTVTMRGFGKKDGLKIGFGEVRAKILPAR